MNLIKSQDFFNPNNVKERCHIIGCGSVGSTIAELLIRAGLTKISLYDFDIVESRNLANQMFLAKDIKRLKVDALKDILTSINPDAESDIEVYPKGYLATTRLDGYVFLAVDNIDLRREIVLKNRFNRAIKAVFDVRTRLTDAQSYGADWHNPDMVNNLLKSMDFSHEEAIKESPLTACNVEMSVAPTIRVICSFCVANFMNFINKGLIKRIITSDAFGFESESF